MFGLTKALIAPLGFPAGNHGALGSTEITRHPVGGWDGGDWGLPAIAL